MGWFDKAAAGLFGGDSAEKASPLDWPWSLDVPGAWTTNGVPVDIDTAVGLPAWFSVISRIADGLAMAPLMVYRGGRAERARDEGSWQFELLHERPGESTPSHLRAEIAASFAADRNAFIRKIKTGRRVTELMVLDPRLVQVERRAGQIVYMDSTDGGTVPRTSEDIIHVRGVGFGKLRGTSPVASLRQAISTSLRRQDWENSYYNNDARPGMALKFPEEITAERAQAVLDVWNRHHQGPAAAGKAAALGGGADLVTIPPVSLNDAQFVQATAMRRSELAGMYGMPPSLVGDTEDQGTAEQDAQRFANYCIGPIAVAVQDALTADRDLFGDGDQFCEFITAGLVRADLATRSTAYRESRQGGWMTANEIRERENLPPHPDGDVLQVTPVGGESNPGADTQETPTDE